MGMNRQVGWWLVLAIVCGLAAGCGGGGSPGNLIAIEPPQSWEGHLAEWRESKDRYMRDPEQSPLRPEEIDGFEGLDYWQPDGRYYFVGRMHLHLDPERFTIISTSGQERPCEKVGWIRFNLEGVDQTLQVYRLLDIQARDEVSSYFLPFMDGTTGKETYPAGRYLDLQGPPGGPYVVDFNRAYNPLCAYGSPERYQCPRTPPENRLAVRIEAGERGYHPSVDAEGEAEPAEPTADEAG